MNSAGYPTYLVNGAVSVNSGVADENGSFWYLDGEIAGWDSPDMRQTMLTRIGNTPSADGEIAADNHYRGRSLVFTLIAECASEAAREASRLLLAGALDLISTTGTFLAEEVIPKQVSIIRSGNSNQGKLCDDRLWLRHEERHRGPVAHRHRCRDHGQFGEPGQRVGELRDG